MNSIIFNSTKYKQINEFDFSKESGIKVLKLFIKTETDIDAWIEENILQELDKLEYDNIFIPLSPGSSFSDFIGLRIALHIRCSIIKSQYANLFIYGTQSLGRIIESEFFDVFKIKGVHLIDYCLSDFKKYHALKANQLVKESLEEDLCRVNLKVPSNYFDNHSIANIWGMYKLLELAKINPNQIISLNQSVLLNIYFKWLIAKNRKNISDDQKVDQIIKASDRKLEANLKVVGKIDLAKFK